MSEELGIVGLRNGDLKPVLRKGDAGVWISPAITAVVPTDEAWLGIQQLHYAAIGEPSRVLGASASDFGSVDALEAYGHTVASVLGQIGATSPAAGDNLLASINEHWDITGSLEGLEACGIAAFQSAARGEVPTAQMEQFVQNMLNIGLPDIAGGGMSNALLYDVGNRVIGTARMDELKHAVNEISEFTANPTGYLSRTLGDLAIAAATEVSPEFKQFTQTVMATATGAAEGAAIGSIIPGVGTTVGAIVGGLIGFLGSVFGGSHSEQQTEAARDLAEGRRVAVDNAHTELGGTKQAVGTDGHVAAAPAAAQGNHPPLPPPAQCPPAPPHMCPLEDDGSLPPEYRVRFWEDSLLIGSAVPIGPGLDLLYTQSSGGAMILDPLPYIDTAGILLDGGVTLDAIYQQELALDRTLLVPQETSISWDLQRTRIGYQKVDPTITSRTKVPRTNLTLATVIIDVLENEGLPPETPVDTALRALAGRGYQ